MDNKDSSNRTVWNLRPQDIGLVASLGDSITAATGAKADSVFGVMDENRGSSFMTGGSIGMIRQLSRITIYN